MSLNGNSPSFHGIHWQLMRLTCVPRTIFSGYCWWRLLTVMSLFSIQQNSSMLLSANQSLLVTSRITLGRKARLPITNRRAIGDQSSSGRKRSPLPYYARPRQPPAPPRPSPPVGQHAYPRPDRSRCRLGESRRQGPGSHQPSRRWRGTPWPAAWSVSRRTGIRVCPYPSLPLSESALIRVCRIGRPRVVRRGSIRVVGVGAPTRRRLAWPASRATPMATGEWQSCATRTARSRSVGAGTGCAGPLSPARGRGRAGRGVPLGARGTGGRMRCTAILKHKQSVEAEGLLEKPAALEGAGDGRPNAMHCHSQAQAVC